MLLTKMANREVYDFLRSVTIKNAYFAEQFKKSMVNYFYRNLLPEDRNPYYLHLLGNYILKKEWTGTVTDPATGDSYELTYPSSFVLESSDGRNLQTVRNSDVYTADALDEMIVITSLDTGKKIPFTREVLHGDPSYPGRNPHKKTLESYKVDQTLFDRLCEKYPTKVDLIKSIVYATPAREIQAEESKTGSVPSADARRMELAISASHLSVISYDSSMLEEAEQTSMIENLVKFIEVFRTRWDVKEYNYEENYACVSWSMLWSLLPVALIAGRYANIRTGAAHSTHIWDYLISQGLSSYRGYLTPDQEHFLYKNIKYLKANRAQNATLNILIDNLLKEFQLHVEEKTVIFDTSETLKTTTNDVDFYNQCKTCSRAETCTMKPIEDYKCSEYLGTKKLFRAEPIVLSTELTGAKKSQIIKLLMSEYGVSKEDAETRYTRSFIWKDEAIEKIKKQLNREQNPDVDVGTKEEYATTFAREVKAGIEPVDSEDVIEKQRREVQHIPSTYLPTKILEIREDPISPKYSEYFNRFFIDTLIRLCPNKLNGTHTHHVTESYKFTVGKENIQFVMNLGEVLALAYFGFLRENIIDGVVDPAKPSSDEDGARRFLTNIRERRTSDIKIPSQGRILFSFKFGCPLKQSDLVDAWMARLDTINEMYFPTADTEPITGKTYYIKNEDGAFIRTRWIKDPEAEFVQHYESLLDLVTNKTENEIYIVKIRETFYAIQIGTEVWEGYPESYEVLGQFRRLSESSYLYYQNNGEIPIIPTYFRWFGDHLDFDPNKQKPTDEGIEDLFSSPRTDVIASDVPFDETESIPEIITVDHKYIDKKKEKKYTLCDMSKYLDVDYIISNLYTDVMAPITSQQALGSYLTKMFDLFYRLDVLRTHASTAKEQLAIKTFLSCCLWRGKDQFEMIVLDGNTSPTYYDWITADRDFGEALNKIDSAPNFVEMWNECNTKILMCLLKHCESPFALIEASEERYMKLKQLIQSLSSYLINFIDRSDARNTNEEIPHVVQESKGVSYTAQSRMFFDTVREAPDSPHVAMMTGDVYYPTGDRVAVAGKSYFIMYRNSSEAAEFDPILFEETEIPEGTDLMDAQRVHPLYNRVNLHDLLEIPRSSEIRVVRQDQQWYYQVGTITELDEQGNPLVRTVPGNLADSTRIVEVTNPSQVTDHVRDLMVGHRIQELGIYIYLRDIPSTRVAWGGLKQDPELSKIMDLMYAKFRVYMKSKTTFVTTETSKE